MDGVILVFQGVCDEDTREVFDFAAHFVCEVCNCGVQGWFEFYDFPHFVLSVEKKYLDTRSGRGVMIRSR